MIVVNVIIVPSFQRGYQVRSLDSENELVYPRENLASDWWDNTSLAGLRMRHLRLRAKMWNSCSPLIVCVLFSLDFFCLFFFC